MARCIIGIDEVGRGPLAGPVAVGAVMVSADFDWSLLENVRDSKKLSEKMREKIYESARELENRSLLRFAVSTSSATYIDKYGIVHAIKRALDEALARLEVAPNECRILLDGSLKAPVEYIHQETIIRGDESEPIISLASIMAKVTRDRLMKRISSKYPTFNFEKHKGYGTALHLSAIARYGLSEMHRATFCSRLHIGTGLI
ncbi:MAG: ribonuclease HII [Patescibacteria group bacterium]|mgnify:CR=1 FL=1